jgi:hypothetical protein
MHSPVLGILVFLLCHQPSLSAQQFQFREASNGGRGSLKNCRPRTPLHLQNKATATGAYAGAVYDEFEEDHEGKSISNLIARCVPLQTAETAAA